MPEYLIPPEAAGLRLDHFLAVKLPHLSRSRLQTLIKEGHIRVAGNTAKPGEKLQSGKLVTVHEPEAAPLTGTDAEDLPLEVLYEDDDLLVLNKAAGMVVHPAAGNPSGTIVNALLHHCTSLSGIGGEQRPGIVHRLDKETSGCLVVAKNDLAHQGLSKQFAGRTILKVYLALASGHFAKKSGVRVSLTAFAGVEALSIAKRTVLYRVAQEALANVARHAQASRVEIHIRRLPKAVGMEIKDDGKAFDAALTMQAGKSKRMGLLGMRERMEMIGGTFAIVSAAGKGTTIQATVPFTTDAKESLRT